MFKFIWLALSIFFLIGMFCLTAINRAFRKIHKKGSEKEIKSLGKAFLYRPFHLFFFPNQEYETLFFATICGQNICRLGFATAVLFFFQQSGLFSAAPADQGLYDFTILLIIVAFFCFIAVSFVFGDYLPRLLGSHAPEKALHYCIPFGSIFLFLSFPFTFLFLKMFKPISRVIYLDNLSEPTAMAKQEIIEIIQEADVTTQLDSHNKKLIGSVVRFNERIAREVMVPRVNLFSLSAETSIKDAAKLLVSEGYSRIPIYRNTVDNIIGVLMYKDILQKYMEYEQKGNDIKVLETPIESIMKGALYTPETKKISHLLQEFRKKQVHLAIVVDEYGGTEGIVTIEDILEQIVGEIEDEYDEEEESSILQTDGAWIVDARMSILDVEEELGLKIPQEGDYDTIGGYIYHCAGSIPSKGFVIQNDEFEMEILRSNDRSVEKVRIKPTNVYDLDEEREAEEE